ncbi:DUF1330 domain-containing protein [Woeseiaceae bacterium]|nr:DUF1330 domain-containing protein [Woeseiaceae bacterium]MDB2544814.1 DUF1330 domain-containing protein [Woeseiaceae bacterium]
MKALMVIQASITDLEKFKTYSMRAPDVIKQFGGKYVCMRTESEQLEGEQDARKIVISEWPSMDAARKFWHSHEYKEIKELRKDAAIINVYIIEKN